MMNRFTPSLPRSSPFYGLPDISGRKVRDLTANGSVDAEFVGFALVAIMSLLTQGSANVAYPNGRVMNSGANVWLSTPSCSCNAAVLEILMKPIEQELAAHIREHGESQIDGFLIEGEATFDAVVRSLHKHSSAGYFSGQPGQLKRMLKNAPKWETLIGRPSLRNARCLGRHIEPRLTVFLVDEPNASNTKMLREASKKGEAGLLNQFFLAHPNDPHVAGLLHRVGFSDEEAQEYRTVVKTFLDVILKSASQGSTRECTTLPFSHYSCEYLDHMNHEVRSNCAPGACWAPVAEYGAGHIERVSRLAGSIHVFEYGIEGEISPDTLQCADAIGRWCVDSVARAIYEPPKLTQAELDAAALEAGLISLFYSEARTQFLKSDIRTRALGLGLMPVRFNRALAVLGEQGKVRTFPHLNDVWIEIFCVPEFSRIPHYLRTAS